MNILFPIFYKLNINHKGWYGCYSQDSKTVCYGPFTSYDMANQIIKDKLINNIDTPYTIQSTCIFMPKFIAIYKLNKKISQFGQQPINIYKN
jgi:hypothetical protein